MDNFTITSITTDNTGGWVFAEPYVGDPLPMSNGISWTPPSFDNILIHPGNIEVYPSPELPKYDFRFGINPEIKIIPVVVPKKDPKTGKFYRKIEVEEE